MHEPVLVLVRSSFVSGKARRFQLGQVTGTAIGGGFLALPYTTAPSGFVPHRAVEFEAFEKSGIKKISWNTNELGMIVHIQVPSFVVMLFSWALLFVQDFTPCYIKMSKCFIVSHGPLCDGSPLGLAMISRPHRASSSQTRELCGETLLHAQHTPP